MLAVKICGIREKKDALFLAQMDVWALGFILVEGSPRYILPHEAKKIVEKIQGKVLAVGVFQDMDWKEVQKLVSFCGFDLVQLHGREDPAFCARFPGKVIKAFGVDENFQGEMVKEYRGVVRYILFDTKRGKSQGGTGEVFPWVKVKELARGEIPVIMAGGLGEENLRELLSLFHPFGVDLNSKVEERPGKKDLKKIQRIIIQLKGR